MLAAFSNLMINEFKLHGFWVDTLSSSFKYHLLKKDSKPEWKKYNISNETIHESKKWWISMDKWEAFLINEWTDSSLQNQIKSLNLNFSTFKKFPKNDFFYIFNIKAIKRFAN